jgi:hypothetical protein
MASRYNPDDIISFYLENSAKTAYFKISHFDTTEKLSNYPVSLAILCSMCSNIPASPAYGEMTFQEIRIISTGSCIANQLRDVNTICRRSW